jgi:hypothetical protein
MAASQQSTLVTEGSSAAGLADTAPGVSPDAMLHMVNVPKTSHEEAVMMQGGLRGAPTCCCSMVLKCVVWTAHCTPEQSWAKHI